MSTDKANENDKLIAALSYVIWLVALFVLISESNKNRPYQRYHAVQGLGFAGAIFIVFIPLICIDLVLGAISSLLSCLFLPVFLVPLAIAVWFAYRAYQGEQFEIPYLTEFLKGQGWL